MSTSRNYNESSPAPPSASAHLSREPPSSPSKNDGSLRLTVKMQPNKLRAATSSGRTGGTRGVAQKVTKKKPSVRIEEDFEPAEILESKRKRARKNYVVDSESDEDMDDVADDDVEEESAMEDSMDVDAEGEDEEDMDLPPPPPIIKNKTSANNKPMISVKPQPAKKETRTVESKQMAASSDEELSELDSEMGDDTMMNDDDAEGEDDEEIEVEDEDEEDEDDDDSDMGGSRASTPDLSKLTKRQRARLEEGGSGYLLALPDEVQVKKHLTAEEHAMRRAEMARRRKNLSEKRNEEEKMETINKLLKKQAPKTNKRRAEMAGGNGETTADGEPAKPNPVFVRWINNKEGSSVSVTNEYLESPVGGVFQGGVKAEGRKMVEEVQ